MYWNYRIIKYGEEDFRLKEVYYNKEDHKPFACMEDHILFGESEESIKEQISMISSDISKLRVINADEFTWEQEAQNIKQEKEFGNE